MTYLFTNDSTLMAFEGPVKPDREDFAEGEIAQHGFERSMDHYHDAISTDRESALPVVNAHPVTDSFFITTEAGTQAMKVKLKPDEVVPLPGWGVEKVYQFQSGSNPDWKDCSQIDWEGWFYHMRKRQAYHLVRSEHKTEERQEEQPLRKLLLEAWSLGEQNADNSHGGFGHWYDRNVKGKFTITRK